MKLEDYKKPLTIDEAYYPSTINQMKIAQEQFNKQMKEQDDIFMDKIKAIQLAAYKKDKPELPNVDNLIVGTPGNIKHDPALEKNLFDQAPYLKKKQMQENVYNNINRTDEIRAKVEPPSPFIGNPGTGLRYNEGKLRYDLMNPFALEQLAKIFTMGAAKYAPRNWEKGMKWTTILASLHRHLAAIDKGEDYDKESGLLHSAHVEWNAHALTAYYKIFPQGDDRPKVYLKPFKVGLDIDGILADFSGSLIKYCNGGNDKSHHWNDPVISDLYTDEIKKDAGFWSTITPLINGSQLPFEPHCYITARSIDSSVTQEWLDKNNFPKSKLYCVGVGESKVDIAKQAGIDIFIDDYYKNFVELNNAGITTYLYTKEYNKKYDVGHLRINSLHEFKERILS